MMLSPGILASCFEMLDVLNRRAMSLREFGLSFPRVGVCRTHDIVEFSQRVSWIRAGDNGVTEITGSGFRILNLYPHESRMRQAVLDYVDVFEPSWVQNATFGRHKVLAYVSAEVKQVIFEAGLATGIDKDTVRFWDSLAAMARGQKDISLSEIGRRGERLTIERETIRTGRRPKWVALENNADGYDVLSIIGPDDAAHLSIEVKSTTQNTRGSLYITRNEWCRATDAPFHCFHLWMLRGNEDAASLLAVVSPADMLPHVPANCGQGEWSSFEVSLEVFKELFQAPS